MRLNSGIISSVPALVGFTLTIAAAFDFAGASHRWRESSLQKRFQTAFVVGDFRGASLLSISLGRIGSQPDEIECSRFELAVRNRDSVTASRIADRLASASRCECAAAHWWKAVSSTVGVSSRELRHHARCAGRDPKLKPLAQTLLGWIAYREQRWADAVQHWKRPVESNMTLFSYYLDARSRAGIQLANSQCRYWIAADLLQRSSQAFQSKAWSEAESLLTLACRLCPESIALRNNLACTILQTGHSSQEFATASRLLDLKDQSSGFHSQVADTRRQLAHAILDARERER